MLRIAPSYTARTLDAPSRRSEVPSRGMCTPASSAFIALVLLRDVFARGVRTRKRGSIVRHDVSTITSPPYPYFNNDSPDHAVKNAYLAATCRRHSCFGTVAS